MSLLVLPVLAALIMVVPATEAALILTEPSLGPALLQTQDPAEAETVLEKAATMQPPIADV